MYDPKKEQWNDDYREGKVLLMDKPLEWTSFDVVKKIRILTGISKVGHAGTLDPLATGLLIVCTGKFTKKINEYMAAEKEYTGTFTLGAITPTYDLESEPVSHGPFEELTIEDLVKATNSFKGDILQVPPAFSAIKKAGIPAYILARKGKDVKMEPRKINIAAFDILSMDGPVVHFRVVCSTGTYIRSLAYDFGMAVGSGAYLSSLRRTRIGQFHVDNAMVIKDFSEQVQLAKTSLP
jgi:tRNA pseudouridine55 synthase